MNYKKIKVLCDGILANLRCQLNDGNPCGTCSHGIFRDIDELKEEVEE